MRWPWQRRTEQREDLGDALGTFLQERAEGQVVDVRRLSIAETCAGIYGRAFAAARVEGWDALTPGIMELIGRGLLFRGEVALAMTAAGDVLPAATFQVIGRRSSPMEWTYRLYVQSPYGGSEEVFAPAEAVLHPRIGCSAAMPWQGRSPLSGAMTDAELSTAAAAALGGELKIKSHAILGAGNKDLHGSMTGEQTEAVTATVQKTAAGKTFVSNTGLRAERVRADPAPSIDALRRTSSEEIAAAAGVPPVLLSGAGDGSAAREAYRRLVRSTIEPLGRLLAAEATAKSGRSVNVDFAPLRASDTAMQARAFGALTGAGIPVEQALEISGLVEAE